jgi:hypothetical protein
LDFRDKPAPKGAGHPLCGDLLYGVGGVPLPGSRLFAPTPATCCTRCASSSHPRTGAPLVIECAPPSGDDRLDGNWFTVPIGSEIVS